MKDCYIIEYDDQYQGIFKKMNAEWLELYNLLEPHDLEILNEPRKYILDAGGVVYLAKCEDQIVGSAALIKEHDHVYELAKMAVVKDFRKMGISKLLLEKCLEKAQEMKAEKIVLFSNHQLKAALSLYEKYGFKYIPVKDSPFLTADIKMELTLSR
jgi:ribosomal protein S18 acetylase RimI-like enzyme